MDRNNRTLPKTLIQIHYHNQLCGVNKVVRLYAAAFEKISGKRAHLNFVLCAPSSKPGIEFSPAQTIPEPLCDYLTFSSKAQFVNVKSNLVSAFNRLFTGPSTKFPLCVIGHNLSLGKNCALSAAFAEMARQYSCTTKPVRFISVIHDFAEEGRGDCLAKIENVRQWTDIDADLFPKADTVRLVTLNDTNVSILGDAGFGAQLLYNPVAGPTKNKVIPKKPTATNKEKLFIKAKLNGTIFHDDRPVVLYPSRCISRKNILEALLICNSLCKANLLIGNSGADPKDKILYKNAIRLCSRQKLPVLFDYGGILSDQSAKGGFTNRGFDFADACITTSIAEGFGYGLFEPWLFNKAVFGRNYLGFKPIANMRFPGLYDRLPVPVKWLSISQLRDKYWEAMHNCFGMIEHTTLLSNRKKFNKAFNDFFIKDESIDFAGLDAMAQFSFLQSVVQSPGKIDEWEGLCGKELATIKKAFDTMLCKSEKTIRHNKRTIEKHLSLESFSKKLQTTLSIHPQKKIPTKNGSRDKILKEFCTFERFRLLLGK
jgi:hypothetical protein